MNQEYQDELDPLIQTIKAVYLNPDQAEQHKMEMVEQPDGSRTLSYSKVERQPLHQEFEKLINDINSVLFYLSNVEVERCQATSKPSTLKQPIEIVHSITDIFKW